MIASGSGDAIRLKLYVMAPTWTPLNFESMTFAANALASGTEANAALARSRLVNSIATFVPERRTRGVPGTVLSAGYGFFSVCRLW
jgi:hypothetical protein